MLNKIRQATDEEAESLIKTFNDRGEIVDQDDKGKGKIISIEGGTCTIEFENGDVDKCQHHFFHKTIVKKVNE